MITAQDYINGLRQLRERATSSDVPRPDRGVCGNLSQVLDDFPDGRAYRLVELYGAEWEHATFFTDEDGEQQLDAYFVPHTEGVELWDGENLRMRLLLLDFLIECLEERVERGLSVLRFD